MRKLVKENILYLIGGGIGAIGGYMYYIYVGCSSGACPITSSPVMSVIAGGLMGALLLSMFKKENKENGKAL